MNQKLSKDVENIKAITTSSGKPSERTADIANSSDMRVLFQYLLDRWKHLGLKIKQDSFFLDSQVNISFQIESDEAISDYILVRFEEYAYRPECTRVYFKIFENYERSMTAYFDVCRYGCNGLTFRYAKEKLEAVSA